MTKRLRRKDLKAPDEFLTATHQFLEYTRSNSRQIGLAGAALAALIVVAIGVRTYREYQEDRAQAALAAAYSSLRKGSLDVAGEGFAEVHTAWPRTRQGELALAYAGNAFAETGNDGAARKAFETLAESTEEPLLRQIAYYSLGELDRKEGRSDSAMENLEKAAGITGPLRIPARVASGSGADLGEVSDGIGERLRQYLDSASGAQP